MKKFIKDLLALIDYKLYLTGIKKCPIRVHTVDETIDELLNTEKSMVRFGDSDITIIRGKKSRFQTSNPQIIDELKRIIGFQYDNLIVTIPDIFGDLSIYKKESQKFWREHLMFARKTYEQYCNTNKIYYNTSVSRFYCTLEDQSQCDNWIFKIKEIWKDKDVVVVEGISTHNGVGNDLLDTAKSVERIIGPGRDAYFKLDEIYAHCTKYSKDRLFLISLGSAAKPLTEKLFLDGYRVLDIGNLDTEYDWYLKKCVSKEKNPKHDIVTEEMNIKAGYTEYLEQIKVKVI